MNCFTTYLHNQQKYSVTHLPQNIFTDALWATLTDVIILSCSCTAANALSFSSLTLLRLELSKDVSNSLFSLCFAMSLYLTWHTLILYPLLQRLQSDWTFLHKGNVSSYLSDIGVSLTHTTHLKFPPESPCNVEINLWSYILLSSLKWH